MRVRRRLISQVVQDILDSQPDASREGYIDPELIAEANGLVVRRAPLEDSLSGFLVRDDSGNTFIGVNQTENKNRQRFTIAHELGHFFLHDRSEMYLDSTPGRLRIMARDLVSSDGSDIREIEANLFAAELLMPTEMIRADLQNHTHVDLFSEDVNDTVIGHLAQKYHVSVRAMTIRLERLGVFGAI